MITKKIVEKMDIFAAFALQWYIKEDELQLTLLLSFATMRFVNSGEDHESILVRLSVKENKILVVLNQEWKFPT